MRISTLLSSLAPVMVLAACSSGTSTTAGTATATPPAAEQAPSVAAAPAPSTTSVSAAQATRGENAFMASCTACHSSTEFTDGAFQRRWRNRTARNMYNMISNTMPEDAPGSLASERYVEIVTYVLRLNGFPTGAGPDWDLETLSDVDLGGLGSR